MVTMTGPDERMSKKLSSLGDQFMTQFQSSNIDR